MSEIIELRFYVGGFIFRVFTFAIRWNKQDNYTAISLEHLKNMSFVGGMTWKELRLAKKQAREAKHLAMERTS